MINLNLKMPLKLKLRYFTDADFRMDGHDVSEKMNAEFLRKLDECRHLSGTPFVITSAFRSSEKNKLVGGAPASLHLKGRAVDIMCTDPVLRYRIVQAAQSLGLTVGVMERGLHLDDRKVPIMFHYYSRTKEATSLNE